MTVENVLKLLALHKANGNKKQYADLLEHIGKSRKFKGIEIPGIKVEVVKDEKPKR